MKRSEEKEIMKFVKNGYDMLSPRYKEIWTEWLEKRDAVAKRLELTEDEVLWVTKREMARMIANDIRVKLGLNESTKQQVHDTKGNTDELKFASSMAEIFKEYDKKCCYFSALFDLYIKNHSNPGNKQNTKR